MQFFPLIVKIQWVWPYPNQYVKINGERIQRRMTAGSVKAFFSSYHLSPLTAAASSKVASSQALAPCHIEPSCCACMRPARAHFPVLPSTLPCAPCPSARPTAPASCSSPPKLISAPPITKTNVGTLAFSFLAHKALNWSNPQPVPKPPRYLLKQEDIPITHYSAP